jgi:ferritin
MSTKKVKSAIQYMDERPITPEMLGIESPKCASKKLKTKIKKSK